ARPLGIGVSGLTDAIAILDVPFESRVAEVLNKAVFACMYFNGIAQSSLIAERDGEYPLFRTGTFTLPRANDEPPPIGTETPFMSSPAFESQNAIVNETFAGSPTANGFFQ